MCGCLQYLDLGKTYVHWKQGHPQAAAQDTLDDASDVSSEEGVNADSGTSLLAPKVTISHCESPCVPVIPADSLSISWCQTLCGQGDADT